MWTHKMGVCVFAVLASAGIVEAATVGFQVRVGGGKNAPIIRLINTSSDTDAEIVDFKMTIGDASYNFDYFWLKSSPTMSYNLLTPDLENGGSCFDEVHATFTDFGPGKWFRIKTDIDRDGENGRKDNWHKVLYDLGGNSIEDNAEFHVAFSTGHEMEGYLKDYNSPRKRVRYGRSVTLPAAPPPAITVIPLPLAAWSGIATLTGLGGLGLVRRNLKRMF